MRCILQVMSVTAALAMLAGNPPPAQAQSLFEKLFGAGPARTSMPASQRPVPSLRSLQRYSPFAGRYPRTYSAPSLQYSSPSGSFRTLCVRTCDGYYWPINNNSSRSRFHEEAQSCRQSCDSEAKLYYLPHGSDDIESMTDLSGQSYGELANAFQYRKTLIAGCSCRPMPWNQSEHARHAQYALSAQLERDRQAVAQPSLPALQAVSTRPAAIVVSADEGDAPNGDASDETTSGAASDTSDADQPAGPVIAAEVPPEMFSDSTPAPIAPAPVVPPATAEAEREGSDTSTAARADQPAALPTEPAETASVAAPPPRETGRRQRVLRTKHRARTASASGWFGPGGAKYAWPGDAPRRLR